MATLIALGLLALVAVFTIAIYNKLVKLKTLMHNAWADVDVHLKKRHDLIPNLVNTVKGYAGHESETLEKVIAARNKAVGTDNVKEQIEAEGMLGSMIPKIFALAEQYPELKANENFMSLQKSLMDIENGIEDARRYYNAVVRDYNTTQEVFPNNLIAGMFSFGLGDFFDATEEETKNPQVQF